MQYIVLENGLKYRAEVNLNALEKFCNATGITDFAKIDQMQSMCLGDIKTLIHACITEGERMDGRTLELDATELGAQFRLTTVAEFMQLFASQSQMRATQPAQKKTAARKWPWIRPKP